MAIKLMTDGSVDVPANAVEEYGITVVPPVVTIDGEEYLSGVTISPAEFMERQRTARELPRTSQPSPGQFAEAFEEALGSHEQVLLLTIAPPLSGTLNSARQAALTFPSERIVIHDTGSLSAEAGMQVVAAARSLRQHGSIPAAVEAARRTHEATKFVFSVDDLTFLIKGGRLGRVAGMVGTLLSVRPILTVDKEESIITPIERVRTFRTVLKKLLEHATATVGAGNSGRFFVVYGETETEAAEVRERLHEQFKVRWFHSMMPGPTLLAHTGPRALGLVIAPGDWED